MTGRMSAVAPIIRTTAVGACLLGLLGIVLYFATAKERRIMNMSTADRWKSSTILGAAVPPIDAAAPAKVETATFALG